MIAFAWAEFSLGLLTAFILIGCAGFATAIWLFASNEDASGGHR